MLGVTPKGTELNGTPSRCDDPGNVLIQKPAATTALGQLLSFPSDWCWVTKFRLGRISAVLHQSCPADSRLAKPADSTYESNDLLNIATPAPS